MSLRAAANILLHYGRIVFCEVVGIKSKPSRIAENLLFRAAQDAKHEKGLLGRLEEIVVKKILDGRRPYFAHKILRWITDSPAAELRRNAAKRLMYGGRQLTPYLGFVGINLISGHGLVTKKNELEGICEEIRLCVDSMNRHSRRGTKESVSNLSLDDLEIGPVIAKGCNAIVHYAKWKQPVIDNLEIIDNESVFTNYHCGSRSPSNDDTSQSEEQRSSGFNVESGRFGEYNLAVKMMFNYEAESNASTILRVMRRETLPARFIEIGKQMDFRDHNNDLFANWLPPHVNLVNMVCAFVDSVPFLPDALALYPNALPRRLHEDGCGRNMTLFLVMQRYDYSLYQYLKSHTPSPTSRLLLLLQLFEAIIHLARFNVAHRDLKSDNILIDTTEGIDCPRLVVTDFGCCLVSPSMRLSYTSEEIERGGNCALMAPEVCCAQPGTFSVIDYSRADLWTAATMAFEIYGQVNPFYGSTGQQRLDNRTYGEADLPSTEPAMPDALGKLIKHILRRNPKRRPSLAVAANVCHLLLWGPQAFAVGKSPSSISVKNMLEWLVMEAAVTVCENGAVEVVSSPLLTSVRNTFLSRVRLCEIEESLAYF